MSSSTANSNGQIYEGTPPVFTGGVIDGIGTDIDFSTDTTTMSAEWSAAEDSETGVAGYLYAIGTTAGATDVVDWTGAGLATSAVKSGLALAEGQKYYFAVEAVNGAGGISEAIVSDGVVIDTTQPEAVAGLYDGDKSLVDRDFASSTSDLSANWTPASDGESGIAGYVYAIGTSPSGTDIADWSEVGNVNCVTKSGLTLTDGDTYYIAVKAINNVGMMSETVVSDGQTVDSTSPEAPSFIYDGLGSDMTYATSSSVLSANWAESSDLQSGIDGYLYAIGTSTGATDVVGWADNGNATSAARTGLTLTNGEKYYFSVKAMNGGGGLSGFVSSDGQIVDYTQPSSLAYVRDGTGDDLSFSTSTSVLSANWAGAVDGESGVVAYWFAIGTNAGATDVINWTSNATNTLVTKSGLTLENGKKYYVAVKSENGAGLFSDAANSNGAVIDTTAPSTIAVVYDGSGSDVQYSTSSTRLTANWTGSGDPQSGIAAYWFAIGTSAGATDILGWTSNGLSTSVTYSGLTLTDGSTYYFSVKSQNGAGLFSAVKSSNGQTVDITPPGPVTGLAATPGNNQVSLSWTNPADSDFTGVTIVRKSSGFPEDASDGDLRYEGEAISFVDEGVDNNTAIYYSVFAYDHLKLYAEATSSAQVSVIPYANGLNLHSGWNLVGASVQDASINPTDVFDTSDYEIIGMDGGYAYFSPSTGTVGLSFARGYWIYSEEDIGNVDVGSSNYTSANYTISLSNGWNLIADPYIDLINWGAGNAAIACGGVATNLLPVYYFDQSESAYIKITPDSGNKIIPWVGYWIYAGSESCDLTITK